MYQTPLMDDAFSHYSVSLSGRTHTHSDYTSPLCWVELLFLTRMCYILHMCSHSRKIERWELDQLEKKDVVVSSKIMQHRNPVTYEILQNQTCCARSLAAQSPGLQVLGAEEQKDKASMIEPK